MHLVLGDRGRRGHGFVPGTKDAHPWFLVLMISRRRNVENAAMHAAGHRGVAPLDETLDYGPAS